MPNPPEGPRARRIAACSLAAAGIVGLVALVMREGKGDVLAVCGRVGFGVVPIVAAPAVGIFLHALAWRTLLPPSARPALPRAYRTFISAQAGNELGFGFLGETFKVLALRPSDREVGVSVVALDNLTAAIALILFYVSLGSLAATPELPSHGGTGLGVILGAAGIVGILIVASTKARRIARTSLALLTEHPGRAALAVALHLLGKLWLVAEMALAMAMVGKATLHGAVVLALASATAAAVGAPVPGQLGVAEGALVAIAPAAGLPAATALAIGLLRRLRSSLWLALGAAFALPLMKSVSLQPQHRGTHAQATARLGRRAHTSSSSHA